MGGVCTRGKEVHPEEQDQNNLGSNTGPQQSGDKQTGGKGASRQNSARTRESFDGESMESARMATHRSGAPLNSSRSNRGQLNSHRSDGGGGRQNSFRSYSSCYPMPENGTKRARRRRPVCEDVSVFVSHLTATRAGPVRRHSDEHHETERVMSRDSEVAGTARNQ
eukprot:327254-Rhodomonas_salina.1